MLSAKTAEILLTVYPELNDLKRRYLSKAKRCLSFEYNSSGIDAATVFAEFFAAAETYRNLKLFGDAMSAALGILSPEERAAVKSFYMLGESAMAGAKRLGVEKNTFRSAKRRAVRKFGAYIEVLGFDEKRILECFDSEYAFVDAAEEVEARYVAAARFKSR